jgi:LPS sulfotransferase NodH
MTEEKNRTESFKRNPSLEVFLSEINDNLYEAEKTLLEKKMPEFPIIFIMGPLRSGSTLITQWLANSGIVAYPTNLMSRFYKAPIMGSKIQRLLTDERYNFRNEIRDFNSEVNFSSENGKTKGALAPNEFWYFWKNFLPDTQRGYWRNEELFEKADIDKMLSEFAGITDVFQKPFALKGMNLNYNIDFLNKVFDKVIFIHSKRDPLTNIASILKARERQLGSIENWYSFKIPEYEELVKYSPYEQAAGQVHFINQAVEKGLEHVEGHKKITIHYEDFCKNPKYFYDELVQKMNEQGCRIDKPYSGERSFSLTRKEIRDEKIINANRKFES